MARGVFGCDISREGNAFVRRRSSTYVTLPHFFANATEGDTRLIVREPQITVSALLFVATRKGRGNILPDATLFLHEI